MDQAQAQKALSDYIGQAITPLLMEAAGLKAENQALKAENQSLKKQMADALQNGSGAMMESR